MSSPLVSDVDLGVYLKDTAIDSTRAVALIADAQTLCESVVSPLPTTAAVVVKRVAGRAYVSVTSPRQAQMAAAGSPFGGAPGPAGGVWLSKTDKADLRRMAGGSAAFSIDPLDPSYVLPADLPYWDATQTIQ